MELVLLWFGFCVFVRSIRIENDWQMSEFYKIYYRKENCIMDMFRSFQAVMADEQITAAGKSVFLNLLSRMDCKGYCYPAVATMEKETGYSERTIQRQTNYLADKGYIIKAEQKAMGKQYTNRYYLAPHHCESKFLFSDVDLRNKIYDDKDFQNFLKQEEVNVKTSYKNDCIQRIYRKLTLEKIEKLIFSYLVMRADREGFVYFTVERLQEILKLSVKDIRKSLKSLKFQNFLVVMEKFIDGEKITLVRIRLEKLGLHKFVKRIIKKQTYKIGEIVSFLFRAEQINHEKWMVQRMLCRRGTMFLTARSIQNIGLHTLFRSACHPKNTIVIKRLNN